MSISLAWFEIPVTDLSRAKIFYETIFDIKIQLLDLGALKIGSFPASPSGVSGALCQHAEFYKPSFEGPMIYIDANPDLSTILNKVESVGGKILFPKRLISPDQGYTAIFIDTEGNRIGLRSKS
ncbi:VOC family protein [Cytophagaceae bacterium YF14B1]|uniref:VOC family protein n=1 Tax=Xanthocytophaga flava TaxID=3048013 RepID=A0AAE3QS72_9BACT|nr:VOC family protein [Xanthocytophaga flavus]MDJ1484482.1 VOC family protein [Xanthocytophaga flavus]